MNRPDDLIARLREEEVARARRTPPSEKAIAGPRLFDWACRITMDGIRAQHPDADEAEVRRILRERLRMRDERERRT